MDATTENHAQDDRRPLVAYVVHTLSPFRMHIQRRIARELPWLRLATLVSWNQEKHLWKFDRDDAVGLTTFPGGVHEEQHGSFDYFTTDWKTGKRLIAWCREHRPKAVVMCGYSFPSHYRLIAWLRRRGIPYFLWSDSNALNDSASGLARVVKNLVVKPVVKAAAGVMPCGVMGARYYARYGAVSDRTFFSPVEPDYGLIENARNDLIESTRARFGLDPARRRLVSVCRLVPLKGIADAIGAFARIANERPDWDYVIVGDGPSRGDLESHVPAELKHRFLWTGFIDDQATVSAIYRQCDAFVHPATWEAWGVVLLEAAAAGLPIVASNVVGAAPDLVRDGESGVLVPPRDQDALARAFLRVTDPANLAHLKRTSREVSQEFRRTHDPVAGLARALRSVGVQPA